MTRAVWQLGWTAIALCAPIPVSAQLLASPLRCTGCVGTYYYMDHGSTRDYSCASSTYPGHSGTDYSMRSGNASIDDDNEVVAMAAGTVVKAEDGYYDRCTQCGGANCGTGIGNGFANQVIINHGRYRVIYGHMKQGSIAVAVGDTVSCGQRVGFVGSSGCSTGAHLHIEPSEAALFGQSRYTPIDPYAGACSDTPTTLFVEQGAHRTMPGAECDATPSVPQCPADSFEVWTCDDADALRRRCVDGVQSEEACAWGCTRMAVGTDDVCALPPDADGDGSRADVDCDDSDGTRHPGALESCGDGVDQDCGGDDMACPTEGTGGMTGGAGGFDPMPGAAGSAGIGTVWAPLPEAGSAGAAGAAVAPLSPKRGNTVVGGCNVAAWGRPSAASQPLPWTLWCLLLTWSCARLIMRPRPRPPCAAERPV